MFPTRICGHDHTDIHVPSTALDCTKPLAVPQPARHSLPAHLHHTPQIRSIMSTISSSQANAGLPPLPVGSRAAVSSPGQGFALPTHFVPYSPVPLSQLGLDPQSAELHNLNFIHTMNRMHAGPLQQPKLKTPINRNYLELALLVCNTFHGKLFPCPHCRYVTDRRNNLKRHLSTMHQTCDKMLECCGVSFSTKASLREHITIFHHNGYSCHCCGRRFCRKALLRRHLSVHSGQKDYTCPNCDYATSHKSNLERHKRIHEKLKLGEDGSLFDSAEFSGNKVQSANTTDTSCIDIDKKGTNCDFKDNSTDDSSDDIDVTDDTFEHDNFQSGHFVNDVSVVKSPCSTTENKHSQYKPHEKGHIRRILANEMTTTYDSDVDACVPLNSQINTSNCDKNDCSCANRMATLT